MEDQNTADPKDADWQLAEAVCDLGAGELVYDVPPARILAGDNPRTTFDLAEMEALKASIAENGLIQPIILRRAPGTRSFHIVAGERRFRACKELGWKTVPAIVRPDGQNPDTGNLSAALVENLQREDLNPVDEARALSRLAQVAGSATAAAKMVGRAASERTVRSKISLLKLPGEILAHVAAGTIPPTRAAEIAHHLAEHPEAAEAAVEAASGSKDPGKSALQAAADHRWLASAEREGDEKLEPEIAAAIFGDDGKILPDARGRYVDLSEKPAPEELRPGIIPRLAPTFGRILGTGERALRALVPISGGKSRRRVRVARLDLVRERDRASDSPVLRAKPCSRPRAERQAAEAAHREEEERRRRLAAAVRKAVENPENPHLPAGEILRALVHLVAYQAGEANRDWLSAQLKADVLDPETLGTQDFGGLATLLLYLTLLAPPPPPGRALDVLIVRLHALGVPAETLAAHLDPKAEEKLAAFATDA